MSPLEPCGPRSLSCVIEAVRHDCGPFSGFALAVRGGVSQYPLVPVDAEVGGLVVEVGEGIIAAVVAGDGVTAPAVVVHSEDGRVVMERAVHPRLRFDNPSELEEISLGIRIVQEAEDVRPAVQPMRKAEIQLQILALVECLVQCFAEG